MVQERKGKKRVRKQPPVDDDLNMLASVLAEMQLDNTAYGWFRPSWRNGVWAAKLAMAVAFSEGIFDGVGIPDELAARVLVNGGWSAFDAYEQAGALYTRFVTSKMNTNTARLIGAALRCMQLKIAHSDGGGGVYNEILIPMFLPLEPRLIEHHVLEFRCHDSIGTTSHLMNDHNDRQRRAFRIAWERGLYLAAYSLPPAY